MSVGTLLAIDTAGAAASVAVYRDQVLAEVFWQSGRRHSEQILPAVDRALSLAGVEKRTLAAVAVGSGPGSYAGLRVGVSTAMALALALEIGVVQVPTLDVIAWSQAAVIPGKDRGGRSVRAAIDVGRAHYATARFRRVGPHLEHETRVEMVRLGELVEVAAVERALLVVDLEPQAREHIERQYGAEIDLASPAASARRAGFLAELAALKLRHGEAPASVVEPIYLRQGA
ncbi:MAG: tRNA (adenosine(37)-N6)-threonylcarbamoyltransferase complex dimerization subunit type 1 TsaB [Chloroflexi bacterium]|nr:tRNA (adenosine(37)-N6)-threonylcarbamoyltransferase complex dimerization subunit type 1 TsaB [Chloroflexota bacterium]